MKLEAVGLRGAANLMPNELSGGMARRVALAAVVRDASLAVAKLVGRRELVEVEIGWFLERSIVPTKLQEVVFAETAESCTVEAHVRARAGLRRNFEIVAEVRTSRGLS